jgi:hypothetical protein
MINGSPERADGAGRAKARRRIRALLAAAVAAGLPALARAAAEKATSLNAVADTRDMAPGFAKAMADTYNGNLYVFGLCVVLIMAAMGAILGFGVDKLMSYVGIDLGKMDHRE